MTTHKLTKEETDRYADLNGTIIHYNEAGEGPTLMCFHGGGPGASAWGNTRHNIDALSQHFHVMLVDLPGFGESDKNARPPENESSDVYLARLLRDLLDSKGIEKSHLYSSSASGPPSLRFGIDYPDRVDKIIMQSSGVGGGPLMFSPSPAEGIKALGEFDREPTRERMARMMHLFIPKDELCTEEMIDARFQAAMIPGHLEARRATRAGGGDILRDISRLKAPVLVVWGHQDWMVPVEGALGALARIPDVRVHIWGGGTGHFVEYEKADEFNRLVIDFLTH